MEVLDLLPSQQVPVLEEIAEREQDVPVMVREVVVAESLLLPA